MSNLSGRTLNEESMCSNDEDEFFIMRKIFLVTERRADYSRFKPILKMIEKDPELDYDLVVTGIHLKEEHGYTINEIIEDGFKIFSTFEMFVEDCDTGGAMTRSLGNAMRLITYELEKSTPDLILSGFDIAANFAVTVAGAHMNIPVVHIQGGEITGTIDESIRHATSKFAHYHLAANDDACRRLIKMGEIPSRVFSVGCPSIDAIKSVKCPSRKELLERFKLKLPYALVLQHPVTSEIGESGFQINETLEALLKSGIDALMIHPNNDAGYTSIVEKINKTSIQHVPTLALEDYIGLLTHSSMLVGNSSSGIHETPTFNIPTINIGTRQSGRLRADNVVDVGYDRDEIERAIDMCLHSQEFLEICRRCKNPYGEGDSAPKIVRLLKEINIGRNIIQKRITY